MSHSISWSLSFSLNIGGGYLTFPLLNNCLVSIKSSFFFDYDFGESHITKDALASGLFSSSKWLSRPIIVFLLAVFLLGSVGSVIWFAKSTDMYFSSNISSSDENDYFLLIFGGVIAGVSLCFASTLLSVFALITYCSLSLRARPKLNCID